MRYKRKFLVEGETILGCSDFIEECQRTYGEHPPCTTPNSKWHYLSDTSKCPYPINKPNQYVVAITEDGEWQCSCPYWKYRHKECKHIRKVKQNPEAYEISTDWTEKQIDALRRVTG